MNEEELEKFLPYMEEYDMTHQQKLDFLETLWRTMQHFVDAAFDPPPLLPEREESDRAA